MFQNAPPNSILVDIAVPPIAQLLTYEASNIGLIPTTGLLVSVPLGRRSSQGYIVRKSISSPQNTVIKQISGVVRSDPAFAEDQLPFFEWVAQYYGESLSTVIDMAVPPFARRKQRTIVHLCKEVIGRVGSLQEQLIQILKDADSSLPLDDLQRRYKGALSAIKRLQQKGVVSLTKENFNNQSAPLIASWAQSAVTLTREQTNATNLITTSALSHEFSPILLHGVTGSGKTEVYLESIQNVLKHGGGALVIVPEIALTPQLVDRFRARLGDCFAILHSALQPSERWNAWERLLRGELKVAIGARSAVFAPIKDLRLVIVDEEHDGSFKQADSPRYHGRDLAIARAKVSNATVILGSATPSLETFFNAQSGKYKYISLPSKFSLSSKSKFEVVDLREIKFKEMPSRNVSPTLQRNISEALERKEQIFILLNRRGFASYLQCNACGYTSHCKRCSTTMTYHKKDHTLRCHLCNQWQHAPNHCPECKHSTKEDDSDLISRGAGTERIVDELLGLFPDARIERLDRDAAQSEVHFRRILDRVRNKEADILVGTQMIAKGHDLPDVTVVGIIDCDVGLHIPDFRASERVFQLLSQVSGRAGRADKPGVVVLQTRVPQHRSIEFTVSQNYEGFAQAELQTRKELNYPPYKRVLRALASSKLSNEPLNSLIKLRALAEGFIKAKSLDVTVIGPAPTPIVKIKDRWRAHLLFKSAKPSSLQKLMTVLKLNSGKSKKVRVVFDLDAHDLL